MDSVPTQSARSARFCDTASDAFMMISMPVPHTRCTISAGTSIGTPE